MVDLFDALGVTLERVVVTELREATFFAELHLASESGTQQVSARPSDAVALAVRTGAPIFAEEDVVSEAAQEVGADVPEEEQDEVVEEFRRFIEDVDPEDFAS